MPLGQPGEHGTGLIEIDREKCLEPLAAKSLGRIAYATDAGARILPVNYILAESSITFARFPTTRSELFEQAISADYSQCGVPGARDISRRGDNAAQDCWQGQLLDD